MLWSQFISDLIFHDATQEPPDPTAIDSFLSGFQNLFKNHVPEIPRDIIQLILDKLPTKSLLRFSAASRYFQSLVLELTQKRSREMILVPASPLYSMFYNGLDVPQTVKLHTAFQDLKDKEVIFAGSWNGIVLLIVRDYYHSDMYVYGLANRDCLKVVRLRVDHTGTGTGSYEIFYVSTSTWSSPGKIMSRIHYTFQKSGTYLNGSLYWPAFDLTDKQPMIIRFDLNTVRFNSKP